MPTIDTVGAWILDNILDTAAWESSDKQEIALNQASRNLMRWYPDVELSDELLSYQVIWELQGLDPVLKYGKQGIKAISEGSDRIDYLTRDKVAPDVRDILGSPAYEKTADEPVLLDAGRLV